MRFFIPISLILLLAAALAATTFMVPMRDGTHLLWSS